MQTNALLAWQSFMMQKVGITVAVMNGLREEVTPARAATIIAEADRVATVRTAVASALEAVATWERDTISIKEVEAWVTQDDRGPRRVPPCWLLLAGRPGRACGCTTSPRHGQGEILGLVQ
jgi:hypothetical protein